MKGTKSWSNQCLSPSVRTINMKTSLRMRNLGYLNRIILVFAFENEKKKFCPKAPPPHPRCYLPETLVKDFFLSYSNEELFYLHHNMVMVIVKLFHQANSPNSKTGKKKKWEVFKLLSNLINFKPSCLLKVCSIRSISFDKKDKNNFFHKKKPIKN